MDEFKRSKLWIRGLDEEYLSSELSTFERSAIARLREAFFSLRHRASALATEISHDVPSLTLHDLSHLDALWETADTIVGDELLSGPEPYLNPLETFVLGCAFLTHDLVQSRAALGMSDDDLRRDIRFADILVSCKVNAADDEEAWAEAISIYVRENHAELSQTILNKFWPDIEGRPQYLLTDQEIREALARPIGQIASSHGLPVQALQHAFSVKLGAPVFLPESWSCDMIKLAGLIRLSDASHIDARRAPAFVSALRSLAGVSRHHWQFQQKLYRVRREGDRLVYTSSSPFNGQEIEAWWLCHDTLQMIDREIKEVDALFADLRKPRYSARLVAGVDEPRRLAEYIPTDGWVPVDTQIRVGNVAALVTRLGGGQLYGNDLFAPLRELIQNGCDAVLARRLLEERPADWGEVTVELIQSEEQWKLRVSDSGIGMSASVMTGALLDFGTSFWNSSEARKEFPGLRGKRFTSTGRYGIGFFSCFMLGSRIKIISRRYDLGASDTKVLEFRNGPSSRPILRGASIDEAKTDGTKIEIELDRNPMSPGGLLRPLHRRGKPSLNDCCSWLCPTLPVTLKTRDGLSPSFKVAVQGGDWETLPADELLARVECPDAEHDSDDPPEFEEAGKLVRPIYDDNGVLIGRMGFDLSDKSGRRYYDNGMCITVGGCRAQTVRATVGVILGVSSRASRDSANPLYSKEQLLTWATEQVDLIEQADVDEWLKASAIESLIQLGVPLKKIPFLETGIGWLNEEEFVSYCQQRNEIIISSDIFMSGLSRRAGMAVVENVVILAGHSTPGIPTTWGRGDTWTTFPGTNTSWSPVQWHTLKLLAQSWTISLQELFDSSELTSKHHIATAVVAIDKFGNPIDETHVNLFRRPTLKNLSTLLTH